MMRASIGAAVALAGVAQPAGAQPADPVEAASRAVVIVDATGFDTANGNVKRTTRGTGFFINSDGMLVTANHLRTALGPGVDQASITYRVFLSTTANPLPATFMAANAPADMLILYTPVQGQPIGFLRPVFKPSPQLVPGTTMLTALGYPNGFGYTRQPGQLTSWQATISPVQVGWSTSTIFNEGMSGGPVITAAGQVAAIVKGVDQGIGIVVPVSYVPREYWEGDNGNAPVDAAMLASAARVVVTRPVASSPARDAGQIVTVTRSPCDSGTLSRIPVVATSGWTIVPGSAQFSLKSFRGDNLRTAINAENNGGWMLDVDVKALGTCAQNGAVVGDTAEVSGVVTFREAPSALATGEEVIAETALLPGSRIALDPTAQNLTYRLERADGTSEILKPRNSDFRFDRGILQLNALTAATRTGQ